jgi:hypothetical protein
VFGLAIGLAVMGCGGGNNSKSSSTASSASTTGSSASSGAPPGATRFGPGGPPGSASAGSPPRHGIGSLVLRPGELHGFTTQAPLTATTASVFAKDEGIPSGRIKREVARLARAGFVEGAIEHLASAAGAEGLSVADRFRTSSSARAEIAHATKPAATVKLTSFTLTGIPGARGFDESSAQSSGHNIAFAVGSHYYLVGIGWPSGFPNPPSRAQLVAAARQLYKRVHG